MTNETRIKELTQEIVTLSVGIGKNAEGLRADRRRAGKILIQLRSLLNKQSKTGSFQSDKNGKFYAYLRAHRLVPASCYRWINLYLNKTKKYTYGSKMMEYTAALSKASNPASKLIIFRKLVEHLADKYKVECSVTVTAPKAKKAVA